MKADDAWGEIRSLAYRGDYLSRLEALELSSHFSDEEFEAAVLYVLFNAITVRKPVQYISSYKLQHRLKTLFRPIFLGDDLASIERICNALPVFM